MSENKTMPKLRKSTPLHQIQARQKNNITKETETEIEQEIENIIESAKTQEKYVDNYTREDYEGDKEEQEQEEEEGEGEGEQNNTTQSMLDSIPYEVKKDTVMQNLFNNKDKTLKIVPMSVTAPSEYSPFSAPDELKKKFINDVENFLVEKDLTDNNKFKTEIMLLCKSMLDNKSSKSTIEKLLKQIKKLDAERSTQIIDYIPNFYQYI